MNLSIKNLFTALIHSIIVWGFISHICFAQEGRGDVIYVPTPQNVVDEMLDLAQVNSADYLIDLGSGDGRIVTTAAKRFGTNGLGVDLDSYLIKIAKLNAELDKVENRVSFLEADLFETDLTKATVISTYLLPELNLKLRPLLLQLKPGTRIITHDYHMGNWRPDLEKRIPAPEKLVGANGYSHIYYWMVPAKVAGVWQFNKFDSINPTLQELELSQSFQNIEGTLKFSDKKLPIIGLMTGNKIEFHIRSKDSKNIELRDFSGVIDQDKMIGTFNIVSGKTTKTINWEATWIKKTAMNQPDDEKK